MSDRDDNVWTLTNRIFRIFNVIKQYGEENFYISFSGGKDSTVLSALVDMAIPDNKIPRVYADTGIELNMIRDFVLEMQKTDDRIVVIKPSVPIKTMLEEKGYPFKSKEHSERVGQYQRKGYHTIWTEKYLSGGYFSVCPNILRYQFTPECHLKISDQCCNELKEKPLHKWQKENKKPYGIVGLMQSEGGRRMQAQCLAFSGNKLKNFQPLVPVTKEWEDWFINRYDVKICDIYKEPYNFLRTGCKGCPFAPTLQEQLDTLDKYFPNERKQCEIIWKPVYDEYRRIGYRLRPLEEGRQMELEEFIRKEQKDEID